MKVYVRASNPTQWDAAVSAMRAIVGPRSLSRVGMESIEVLDSTPEVDEAVSRLAAAAGWAVEVPADAVIDRDAVAAELGIDPDLLRPVS